jgi:SAM-dependent methyltransferase
MRGPDNRPNPPIPQPPKATKLNASNTAKNKTHPLQAIEDKIMTELDTWVKTILAHPLTKQPANPESFPIVNGIIDARVFLKNTYGYNTWAEGQVEYEEFAATDRTDPEGHMAEIEHDRLVYRYYSLKGRILDCGGGAGTTREFLQKETEYISTDPWLYAPFAHSPNRKAAYSCLNQPLNFIAATAEFQPFLAESFDWVHMRSMIDHVQAPDLAMLEANRVLKKGGRVLVGLYVSGGKSGAIKISRRAKDWVKARLSSVGINRWKDHHVWHPTYKELLKLISDNGLVVEDTYWQPKHQDTVCYIAARKPE